jgi:site-specific recombinase XerD
MARMAAPIPASATLAEARDLWRRSLEAANKAPKTIVTYLFAVDRLAGQVGADRPINKITRADHEATLLSLKGRGGAEAQPASVSTVYRSLRAFWGWVVTAEDLPVKRDPMNGMRGPIVPPKEVDMLSDAELRRVLATCKPRSRHAYLGHRDEAIIRMIATTGIRLAEVANLRVSDVDYLSPEPTFRVLGKGRRPRELPIDGDTLAALKLYLGPKKERSRHAAAGSDWLWLARGGQMSAGGIAQMFAVRGKAAGIARRVHPHELRHRFIHTLLSAGFSEGNVMAMSGHRSRSMMDRYGAISKSSRALAAFRDASTAGLLPKL